MAFKEDLLRINPDSGKQLYGKLTALAKTYRLQIGKSDRTDVWRAVLTLAKQANYVAGGATPTFMIINSHWNCESLSFLIVYLNGYVRNTYLNPQQCTGGWNEASGRRISTPGLLPNMVSIAPPNVSMDGAPVRYSFNAHMWAKIDNIDFDPITGQLGALVAASWPIVVPKDNLINALGLKTYELVKTGKRPNGIEEFNLDERP